MEKADLRGTRELVRKGAGLLGSDIEAEDFDGDESISRGLVCSKDGPKRADTDLMQHPEGAKGWGGRKPGRVVSGQLRCSCFLAAGARAAVNVRKNVTRFPGSNLDFLPRRSSIFSLEGERGQNRDPTPPDMEPSDTRHASNRRDGRLDMFCRALREHEAVQAETTFADGSTRTAIDVRRFSWIRPLAGDYAFDFDKVAPLYAGDPSSRQAWTDAIARTRSLVRPSAAVATLLAAQQARRGAPAAAREAAQKLTNAGTVAILTGQQAGAFGGPLFTLLKAVTAIQLARRTAHDHQADVVAIFWVDAEDHDWDEVASCTVLDPGFQPHTITLPKPEGAGERSVAALTLDARVEHSLDELANALGETEFSEALMATLRSAYRPGVGMADAFAGWLETLLGPYGLVVYDSSDPAAKPLVADLLRASSARPGAPRRWPRRPARP